MAAMTAQSQRRHERSTSKAALLLSAQHPAVIQRRSLFSRSANEHKRGRARLLVSGHNSRKIGKVITKGKWKGFPIFTLTLEERATCPRDCPIWRGCYGNQMPWALRHKADDSLIVRIEAELETLQSRFPAGFVVRLHVLGDFYSVQYVEQWKAWLGMFPALRCFGFTARTDADPIGAALRILVAASWDRFAIRASYGRLSGIPIAAVGGNAGIACPAETGRTLTCSTCALCWSAPKQTITFHEH